MAKNKALELALEIADGPANLARQLSELGPRITSQAISQWQRVPPTRVLAVEQATGMPRHAIRPDLYPVADR